MSGRLRAYVVDDEPGALKQVVQSLKSTGRVEVVGTATSVETALVEIPTREVEALFLDIHMPGMTGFEMLERLTATRLRRPDQRRPRPAAHTAHRDREDHALPGSGQGNARSDRIRQPPGG